MWSCDMWHVVVSNYYWWPRIEYIVTRGSSVRQSTYSTCLFDNVYSFKKKNWTAIDVWQDRQRRRQDPTWIILNIIYRSASGYCYILKCISVMWIEYDNRSLLIITPINTNSIIMIQAYPYSSANPFYSLHLRHLHIIIHYSHTHTRTYTNTHHFPHHFTL